MNSHVLAPGDMFYFDGKMNRERHWLIDLVIAVNDEKIIMFCYSASKQKWSLNRFSPLYVHSPEWVKL